MVCAQVHRPRMGPPGPTDTKMAGSTLGGRKGNRICSLRVPSPASRSKYEGPEGADCVALGGGRLALGRRRRLDLVAKRLAQHELCLSECDLTRVAGDGDLKIVVEMGPRAHVQVRIRLHGRSMGLIAVQQTQATPWTARGHPPFLAAPRSPARAPTWSIFWTVVSAMLTSASAVRNAVWGVTSTW